MYTAHCRNDNIQVFVLDISQSITISLKEVTVIVGKILNIRGAPGLKFQGVLQIQGV